MTKQELIINLHQYTPWELLHQKNQDRIQNMESFNQSLEHPLVETDKNFCLHRAYDPETSEGLYSESLFFPDHDFQGILIIQHDRYTPAKLHSHDFFELLYVYEGEFTQEINGTKLSMKTGDFCLIPPHVFHALNVHNYSVVLNILISKNKFHDITFSYLKGDNLLSNFFLGSTYSANVNDYIIFHTCGNLTVQNIILDMCLETINQNSYYLHFLNTNLLLLFGVLLREYENTYDLPVSKKKKDRQNFTILKYIETNYKTLTLQELAEHFHYSVQHMSHRLKQITGMTFTEYLLQKRMETAAELLCSTNIKIKYIAEQAGYASQEHFIRTFRKYYGTSPSSYRSSHRQPESV